MHLEYNPVTEAYWLAVNRGEADVPLLMASHGLDLSTSATTASQAILFTTNPFCAASFVDCATPEARSKLGWVVREVERSHALSSDRHIDVPADKVLWPYQIASLAYALDRRNTLIADEPGLGKTMQAIAFANEIQAERVLIICPASIRPQWLKKINEWSTMERHAPFSYVVTKSRNVVGASAAWTIVSYGLARSPGILAALLKQRFDLLVIDEVHYAKSHDAARSRAIFGRYDGQDELGNPSLVSCAARILALSGTPLPNRAAEIYGVARALCWDSIDWLSQDKFEQRFNPREMRTTDEGKLYVREEEGRLPELQNRLRSHFMVRHLKKDVLTQLKLPVYDLIQVEETQAIKQALAHERFLDIDPDSLTGADVEFIGQYPTVRREMGEAIAPKVAEYIDMLIHSGESKLVLFGWHISTLDILQAALDKHGLVRVDGRDSARGKDYKIQQFITDPAIKIILGNTLTLGTGVDGLQDVAWHVLVAEPDIVPGNNVQMVDRLHRGGQKGQVQADLFVAPGSILDRILAHALRKGFKIEIALDRPRDPW